MHSTVLRRAVPQLAALAAALFVGMALSLGMLAAAPQQAGAATSGAAHAKSKRQPGMHSLAVGRAYTSFDVNGDGKADRLVIRGTAGSLRGYYTRLRVYVNGRKRLTTAKYWDTRGTYPEVKLVYTKSGVPLLYLHFSNSNGNYAGGYVYRCKGKKYKRLLKTSKLVDAWAKANSLERPWERLKAVKGNKLKFEVGGGEISSAINPVTYTYRYKAGRLVRMK